MPRKYKKSEQYLGNSLTLRITQDTYVHIQVLFWCDVICDSRVSASSTRICYPLAIEEVKQVLHAEYLNVIQSNEAKLKIL